MKEIAPEAATVHGLWRLEGQQAPDGTPAGARRGVLLLVARRTAEGWVGVAAQNTDIVPGADTLLAGSGRLGGASYARH